MFILGNKKAADSAALLFSLATKSAATYSVSALMRLSTLALVYGKRANSTQYKGRLYVFVSVD